MGKSSLGSSCMHAPITTSPLTHSVLYYSTKHQLLSQFTHGIGIISTYSVVHAYNVNLKQQSSPRNSEPLQHPLGPNNFMTTNFQKKATKWTPYCTILTSESIYTRFHNLSFTNINPYFSSLSTLGTLLTGLICLMCTNVLCIALNILPSLHNLTCFATARITPCIVTMHNFFTSK